MVVRQQQAAAAIERVGGVDQQLDRRPHGEVGADGGVDRHQRAACGLLQRGVAADDAVEDGLAVLGFADLQEGVRAGFVDVVALRIHQIGFRRLAGDLAAEDEGGLEVGAGGVACGLGALHVGRQRSDVVHRLGEADDVVQVDRRVEVAIVAQALHHGLGGGQIAGSEQHEHAAAGQHEGMHLRIGVDLIDAGVGERIGREYQSAVGLDGDAVSHGGEILFSRPSSCLFSASGSIVIVRHARRDTHTAPARSAGPRPQPSSTRRRARVRRRPPPT